MSSMSKGSIHSGSVEPPNQLRERVVADIAPFFDIDASPDQTLAQEAARQMLVCYETATGKELQLAAQVVAFGMAALDCLRCSMTERDMPVEILLRMQSNAVALNGMAEKSRKALEARQRDRARGQAATQEAIRLDEAEFQAAIGKARQLVTFARTKLEAHRVGKALLSPATPTATTDPARPTGVAPVTPALKGERAKPEALVDRNDAAQRWAKEFSNLTRTEGQTMH
jgi:hypothetical protein